MLKRSLVTISLMVAVLLMCAQRTASSESRTDLGNMPANGIVVSDVKVYNDQSLQTLLNSLKGRLGQLSGLDQTTLIKAEGSLQGSSARQLEFSMQGSGTPLPGSTTTSSKPGIQTQVTSPTVTPTSPALPNAPSLSPSSNYSQSALNILNEQMQLSYETINLQMLLEGSLSDQYSRGKNIRKRHVTLGFPISITVPNKHSGLWGQVYTGAVAEVEITVCNLPDKGRKKTQEPQEPPRIQELPKTEEPPSLMTILPREKTYNVATISNNLASLGASAIVAGVANIGASFLWAHQTYYLVQDQDTVAFQRSCEPRKCQSCCTFVWQFHPVLGEKTVRQGLRQTFAQISFPTSVDVRGLEKVSDSIGEVTVTTRWRQYDRKTGIVGDVLPGAEVTFPPSKIANFDKSPDQPGLVIVDGHDGTITVTAWGNYQSRTRVRIGSLFLDESTPGFHQTVDYIKFIAPAQALALNGASFVSPTGLQTDIHYSWRDVSEEYNGHGVDLALVGDNLVEVIVPKGSLKVPKDCKGNSKDLTEVLDECNKAFIEANLRGSQYKEELSGPFPLIVTTGGKAFGLGDAPFKSNGEKYVTFLVPKDFIKSQRMLTVKRLFLGQEFMHDYSLPELFDVTGLTILSTDGEKTKFVLLGTGLRDIKILYPDSDKIQLSVKDSKYGTMAFIDFPVKELSGLKQLVLQRGSGSPIHVAIPDSKSSEKKITLSDHDPIGVAKGGVPYTISGPMAGSIVTIQYLDQKLTFTPSPDKKSITLKLPDDMTGSPGIRWLYIIYSDKSTELYKVEVSNPTAKQP